MALQCGLADYHMDEVGSVFTLPHNDKLVGITVKDVDTSGYIYFLYKCTVKEFECEVSPNTL